MDKKETINESFEWRYLIPCKGYVREEIAAALKAVTSFDENSNFNDLEEFILDQDYVTLVPIEIALDKDSRNEVQKNVPQCRFIVTSVSERNAERLQKLGYTVVDMKPYTVNKSVSFESKGPNPKDVLKNHSWAEIKKALEVWENIKPLYDLLGEDGVNIFKSIKDGKVTVTVE